MQYIDHLYGTQDHWNSKEISHTFLGICNCLEIPDDYLPHSPLYNAHTASSAEPIYKNEIQIKLVYVWAA